MTVGQYIPDIIVAGFVVMDTWVIEQFTDHELDQVINNLKITGVAQSGLCSTSSM